MAAGPPLWRGAQLADDRPEGVDPKATPDARAAGRRPVLALIANLFLPPLGHFYVGAARRGLLLWLAVEGAGAAAMQAALRLPGLAALVFPVGLLVLLALATILPIDGFILARARRSGYRLRPYNRWYVYVAIAIVVLVTGGVTREWLRSGVRAYRVPSESMVPTLLVGDFVLVQEAPYARQDPRRADVVVVPYPKDPAKKFVKRVIGLPNEVIEVRNKQVLVDGAALEEPYAVHIDPSTHPLGSDARDFFGPYRIGPREVFVMGDNRDNSNDSRSWGTVPERAVEGKVVMIYFSWSGAKSRVRWSRLGMLMR